MAQPGRHQGDVDGEQRAGDDHEQLDTDREIQRTDSLSRVIGPDGTQLSADHHVMYVRLLRPCRRSGSQRVPRQGSLAILLLRFRCASHAWSLGNDVGPLTLPGSVGSRGAWMDWSPRPTVPGAPSVAGQGTRLSGSCLRADHGDGYGPPPGATPTAGPRRSCGLRAAVACRRDGPPGPVPLRRRPSLCSAAV